MHCSEYVDFVSLNGVSYITYIHNCSIVMATMTSVCFSNIIGNIGETHFNEFDGEFMSKDVKQT